MADSVHAAAVNFPPGFRFRPSDEEIVGYYLKNKVHGNKFEFEVIREVDLYKCEPWDLPEKSILSSRDLEWYFFCPRDRKYPNGSRSNRATEKGYWKATGKDRKVNSRSNKIGTKKTLVFYKGRAPHGERSDWLMHEYRLEASQCKGGSNLQDLYVLSRVFRKPKQGLNDQESIQEAIFPMSNNILSPTDVSDGDVEDQSEERSSLVKQEDDTLASSGLRSETSSEILDNKVEDNNCIEGPGELLQDGSNPNCNLVSVHDTSINENVDSQWGSQKLQSDTLNLPWNEEDFPQIPDNTYFANDDYYQDDNSDLTSLLDYYPELDAFLYPTEEENNDGSSVTELPTSIVDNGIQIQIRSRPEWWQSPQQLPSQGTAMRRIRLQLHKTEESADGRKELLLTDCSSDDSNDSDDSEVITQPEDSQLASSPSQISCCVVEDDADSDIFHDSVESSEIVENGHELNLAPTSLLPSSLFPVGAASVKSVMSVNIKESGGQSVLVEKSESVVSSTYNQSLSLAASPTITIVQDESGSPKEHFNDFTSNDSFTSVTREQTLTGESKRVQKCTVSEVDSRVKAPGQVCVLSDDSLKGEKLASCGISATQDQMEMTVLHTTSPQEMELVSVNSSALGLESPTVLASKVSVSEVAASFGSRQLGAISSNNNAVAETHMSYKGSGNFIGFKGILSGLKPRGKSRPKYVASDHVEESTNVTHNFSDRCSKDSWKVFSSLEKALGIFIQPSQLQSKISKGSNCILLICLLSTALLVLCIWNKWHLARSSSTIIL